MQVKMRNLAQTLVKASVCVWVVSVVSAREIVLVVARRKAIDVHGHEVMESVDVVVMGIDGVSETESGDDHHHDDQPVNETSQMMTSYLMNYSSLNWS